jgi:3,4-dihydroxy-2-butanone 4-phosphate synthase
MASKDEIKRAILKAAGNPSVGVIADIADDLAKAVWELDNTNSYSPAKEARVVDIKETR